MRLKREMRTKGGTAFNKGEIGEIVHSSRGYYIQFTDGREISRVPHEEVEFLNK